MADTDNATRIVPDIEQSLNAHHLRYRKRPTLWPLWLAVISILILLGAVVAGLWLERERLRHELNRVSGEVSNVHARLDAGGGDTKETLTLLQAQVNTLFQEQEQLSIALVNAREELFSLIPASEEMVSADAIETLLQQVQQQQQASRLRDSQLAALSTSLDALEQSGKSARDQMAGEITALKEQDDIQTARLEEIEQTWQERIAALESDIRQLRQSQLALNAQLEMLR